MYGKKYAAGLASIFMAGALSMGAANAASNDKINSLEFRDQVFSGIADNCVDDQGMITHHSVAAIPCLTTLTRAQIMLNEHYRNDSDQLTFSKHQEVRESCDANSLRFIAGKARILGWPLAISSNIGFALKANDWCAKSMEDITPALDEPSRDLLRDISACGMERSRQCDDAEDAMERHHYSLDKQPSYSLEEPFQPKEESLLGQAYNICSDGRGGFTPRSTYTYGCQNHIVLMNKQIASTELEKYLDSSSYPPLRCGAQNDSERVETSVLFGLNLACVLDVYKSTDGGRDVEDSKTYEASVKLLQCASGDNHQACVSLKEDVYENLEL